MHAELVCRVEMNRRQHQRCFFGLSGALYGANRLPLVASDKLELSVDYHLRCVNARESELVSVRGLPFAVSVRRIWVFPSDVIPVVDVFTQNDQIDTHYRLESVEFL